MVSNLSLFSYNSLTHWAFLVAQLVKNQLAMWGTWVRSLGWEDPLEKGRATHSSILALENSMVMGSQRVIHDWVTFTFTVFLQFIHSFIYSFKNVHWALIMCKALSQKTNKTLLQIYVYCYIFFPMLVYKLDQKFHSSRDCISFCSTFYSKHLAVFLVHDKKSHSIY